MPGEDQRTQVLDEDVRDLLAAVFQESGAGRGVIRSSYLVAIAVHPGPSTASRVELGSSKNPLPASLASLAEDTMN